MQYDDYPLPNEHLIKLLSQEYAKSRRAGKVCGLSILEQRGKIVSLYRCLLKQIECLNQFKRANAKFEVGVDVNAHLNILIELLDSDEINLKEMCDNKKQANSFKNINSCFLAFLKLQCEILQLLVVLIFLESSSLDKTKLKKVFLEQLKLFELVVNS